MKYLLIQGRHVEGGVEYKAGDVVETDSDLLRFKNKFQLIEEKSQETVLTPLINNVDAEGHINTPPIDKIENKAKRRRYTQ